MKHSEWTGAEIGLLKRLYPSAPRATIEQALPGRTWCAIINLASLLKVRRRRDWKEVVARHVPVFGLPTDVPVEIKYERPWS